MDGSQTTQSSGAGRHERACPKPVLWWRGGKGSMLEPLRLARPVTFGRYLDPFAGGLSPFLDIWTPNLSGRVVISDANEELIRTYRAVAQSPEAVLTAGSRRLESHSRQSFYAAKHERWEPLDDVEVAARMLYLNRTSFNAMYRIDRRGRFCVSMGHDRSGDLRHRIDAGNLMAVSRVLGGTEIRCCDFSAILAVVKTDDFVFLDPPYPGTCCEYTPLGFTDADHLRLRDVCAEIDRTGAMWLQTNRDCGQVRDLYRGYRMTGACVYRRAGNPSGGCRTEELIITNY